WIEQSGLRGFSGRTRLDGLGWLDGIGLPVFADRLDAGGLARKPPQIIQTGAPDLAAGQHLNLLDTRRMEREDAFDTDPVGDLAHGEGRAIPAAVHLDDDPFERLDPFLLALDDLDLQPQGVADPELGEVLAQRAIFELLNDAVHGIRPPSD